MTTKIIFGDNNLKNFGENWITIDWKGADINMYWNQNSKLDMFEDNSVELIYTSHTIEHMKDNSVINLFEEFYRVLKPGGYLRVVAPNAEEYIKSYTTDRKKFFEEEYGVGSGRTWYEEVDYCVKKFRLNKKFRDTHNLLCLMMCSYSSPRTKEKFSTKMKSIIT